MVSTFTSLETLETSVCLYSINFTAQGHYHSAIADDKYQCACHMHGIIWEWQPNCLWFL
jgi:hypothetical protein